MKIAIAVDDWKLPVFRKALTRNGFEYTDAGALTPDTTLLTIITDDVPLLQVVVLAAQAETAKRRH
jgi:hypothetical protein